MTGKLYSRCNEPLERDVTLAWPRKIALLSSLLFTLLCTAAYGGFLYWAQMFEHVQSSGAGSTGVESIGRDSGWPTACRIIYCEVGIVSGQVLRREVYWDEDLLKLNMAVGAVLALSVGICAWLLTRLARRGMRFSLLGLIVVAAAVGLAMLLERPLTWRAAADQYPLPWYAECTHLDDDWPWFFYPAVYAGLFCVAWWPLHAACVTARWIWRRWANREAPRAT